MLVQAAVACEYRHMHCTLTRWQPWPNLMHAHPLCFVEPSPHKLLPHCMQTMRGNAARKADRLREMVGRYGQCGELATLRVALPLDPSVLLDGILPQECGVFKSAMTPLRLTFRVAGARAGDPFCQVSALPKSCAVRVLEGQPSCL